MRTALCIEMLLILYGRNTPITKQELAQRLETNPRNIAEFKKELELAGFEIECIRGRYNGGYRLNKKNLFPALHLNKKEKQALEEAIIYLQSAKNFLYLKPLEMVLNKLQARNTTPERKVSTIYLNDAKSVLSEEENQMVDQISIAKEHNQSITFDYLPNRSNQSERRRVHPYELIVNEDGFYLLAYDATMKKTHCFKFFKIVKERMQNLRIENKHFLRDPHFQVKDHVGSNSIMKDLYEVELKIFGIQARLINEREIENLIHKTYQDNILTIRFMMAGEMRLKSFILSLGKDCEIIAPNHLKEEIMEELKATLAQYEKTANAD